MTLKLTSNVGVTNDEKVFIKDPAAVSQGRAIRLTVISLKWNTKRFFRKCNMKT